MKINIVRIIALALLIAIFAVIIKYAGAAKSTEDIVELGAMGESYDIIEIDLERFMKDRAASADVQGKMKADFDKSYQDYIMAKLTLPAASTSSMRRMTPSRTLAQEIAITNKAGEKEVLYPAGYTFNPLKYLPAPLPTYYVINAKNEAEIAWLRAQNTAGAMILISEGDVVAFSEELELPAYLLTDYIVQQLTVRATPSKVTQDGYELVIREYEVKP